jgi:1,4-alpha-glucan branching enzyme
VAHAGIVEEILNSDASVYGGNNVGNPGAQETEALPWNGHEHSISLTLPPLAGVVLRLTDSVGKTGVTNSTT